MQVFVVFFHPEPAVTFLGGAEKRFVETLKIFLEEGIEVIVAEPKPSVLTKHLISCRKIELPTPLPFSLGNWIGIFFRWSLWTLTASLCCLPFILFRRKNVNLILAPNNTLPNLLPAYFLHIFSRLPLCVVVHHVDILQTENGLNCFKIYQTYRKIGYSRLVSLIKALGQVVMLGFLKRVNTCITVSDFTAEALITSGVSSKKVFVSGNAVDFNFIEKVEYDKESLYDGVFVGRLCLEKGIFDLISAWRKVVDVKRDSQLLIIGNGPEYDRLKSAIEKFGLKNNIILKRDCPDREMYGLVKASKTFAFPSRFEGWGLAVAEALACGLPVVAYNIRALREVFGGCKSVFLVPIDDFEKLCWSILNVLNLDETERTRLSYISKSYIKRFKWRQIAQKDLKILRSVFVKDNKNGK